MDKVRAIFMAAVTGVVLILFGAGIWTAGYYTLWSPDHPCPPDMPAIVTYFVSAVNGTLVANIGALLGVSISASGWRTPKTPTAILQWIAAGWYLIMLVFATVLWGKAHFSEDPKAVVAVLPEIAKTFVGVLIAILAAALGVQAAMSRVRELSQQEAR